MSENKSSFTAGVFLAAGAFVGAWLVSKFYEKKLVNGDVIVGNVRRLLQLLVQLKAHGLKWNQCILNKKILVDMYTMVALLVKNKKNWYNMNFTQMLKQVQF